MFAAMKCNEIVGKQALGPKLLVKPLHTLSPSCCQIGALSSIVNTHWSLLYWEPMRAYFQKGEVSA